MKNLKYKKGVVIMSLNHPDEWSFTYYEIEDSHFSNTMVHEETHNITFKSALDARVGMIKHCCGVSVKQI